MLNALETEIEPPRLLLVPVDPIYAEDIFRSFTDEITHYMYPKPFREIAKALNAAKSARERTANGTDLELVITDKLLGEFFGRTGLHNIGLLDPELGIWIKKASHENGYGREADWGDNQMGSIKH